MNFKIGGFFLIALITLIPARVFSQWEWSNTTTKPLKTEKRNDLAEFVILPDSSQINSLNEILQKEKLNTSLCEEYIYVKALFVKNKFVAIYKEPYNLNKRLRKYLIEILRNYQPNLHYGWNLDMVLPDSHFLYTEEGLAPKGIINDSLLGSINISKKIWRNKSTSSTQPFINPFYNMVTYYYLVHQVETEVVKRNTILPSCNSAIAFDYELTLLPKGKVKINKAYHNQKSLLFIDTLVEQNLLWDSVILYNAANYQKIGNTYISNTIDHIAIPSIQVSFKLYFPQLNDNLLTNNEQLHVSSNKKRTSVKISITSKSFYSTKQSTLNGDSTSIIDMSTIDSTEYLNFSKSFKMEYGESYDIKLPDSATIEVSMARIHHKDAIAYYFFIRNNPYNYSVIQVSNIENVISFSINNNKNLCYYYGSLTFIDK